MQKYPTFCVYIHDMTYDIDKLLREYYRHVRDRLAKAKPRINYYILAKYLEGKTTSTENILVSGRMARDVTIFELIRDSRKETYETTVRYRGLYG